MNISRHMLMPVLCSVLAAGCATVPQTDAAKNALQDGVKNAIALAKEKDPSLADRFETAHGYAVFPTVGKGGVGIGGAYGQGLAFENGAFVGYASIAQATIGFQFGGQAFTEIIFFESQEALDRFKAAGLELSAQVSAVAVTAGASAEVDYTDGVAVFTFAKGGLMYEASVGGQKFDFVAK